MASFGWVACHELMRSEEDGGATVSASTMQIMYLSLPIDGLRAHRPHTHIPKGN